MEPDFPNLERLVAIVETAPVAVRLVDAPFDPTSIVIGVVGAIATIAAAVLGARYGASVSQRAMDRRERMNSFSSLLAYGYQAALYFHRLTDHLSVVLEPAKANNEPVEEYWRYMLPMLDIVPAPEHPSNEVYSLIVALRQPEMLQKISLVHRRCVTVEGLLNAYIPLYRSWLQEVADGMKDAPTKGHIDIALNRPMTPEQVFMTKQLSHMAAQVATNLERHHKVARELLDMISQFSLEHLDDLGLRDPVQFESIRPESKIMGEANEG